MQIQLKREEMNCPDCKKEMEYVGRDWLVDDPYYYCEKCDYTIFEDDLKETQK